MNCSKALAAAVALALFGLSGAARATDVTWKRVTYHDASITAREGDRATLTGTKGDGTEATFTMPISNVPDDIILAYRASHNKPIAERPPTPQEEAAIKAELASRQARLKTLKQMLAKDPFHPVMVVGHIVYKDNEGLVIVCDGAQLPDVPESVGTVFLQNCPAASKLDRGDPIGAVAYKVGSHMYNFQNIDAYNVRPPPKQADAH